ncbi:DUF6796 family protein [Aristaeella lactis]|uniref:Uncharacterized protein n=1 Tax=Aristaeella lactis TaxID=3046383 RepID=A0AC61PKH4_9FIRM|nr:DUF6796 family protein [Aristaeella lactis]QUA51924.1 hypothetical protein JYE50_09360 [Aristaeella lactis]SMC53532.1 hypothetical protein SAMN06297397_1295 [Aristaeella lactis]
MASYNDIGIDHKPDWIRIRKLMIIGLLAGFIVLAGDMLLGWGVHDPEKAGLEGFLSSYLTLSDSRMFWSAFLGLIGIPLEGLCYFAIYRLIASRSMHYAHLYRTGIFGYLIFGGCGVHVPCLAAVFVYRHLHETSLENALELSIRFGLYFLLPATILFLLFWLIHSWAHIAAFAKGLTPYPRWCWVFCLPVGQALTMLLKFAPDSALRNALTAGWISVGNIWMMGGLLLTMKYARKEQGK